MPGSPITSTLNGAYALPQLFWRILTFLGVHVKLVLVSGNLQGWYYLEAGGC